YAAALESGRKNRLKTLLCPIFARSEGDQERFYGAYDLFYSERPSAGTPPAQEDRTPLTVPEIAVNRRKKRAWRTAWMTAGIGVLAIAALAYWDMGPRIRRLFLKPPSVVIEPPEPPPRPPYIRYKPITEPRAIAEERPCAPWECVARGPRPFVLATPLLLALGIWGLTSTRRWRGHLLARREKRRGPPFEWPLLRHSLALAIYQVPLSRAAEALRMRLAGGLEELDIPRTIEATIRAAGFPNLLYRPRQKNPEHLFLIEQRSPRDHFADWWEDVASHLQRLGVAVETYFYTTDLRRCTRRGSAVPVSTAYLLDSLQSQFVLVFGRGRDLLQGSNSIPSWMDASLVKRDHRALLTAAASFEWGTPERTVAGQLPVLAARLLNLPAAAGKADAAFGRSQETAELPTVPAGY